MLRRVAFASARLDAVGDLFCWSHGVTWPVGGKRQTVPRAELAGLIGIARRSRTFEPLAPACDHVNHVNAFHEGRRRAHRLTNADVCWEFWHLFDWLTAETRLVLCPSHLDGPAQSCAFLEVSHC